MASTTKVCRVCGKEYEACHTINRNAEMFRWQEVACSPECGSVYFNKIIESRNPISVSKKTKNKKNITDSTTEISANDPVISFDDTIESN